MSDPIPMRLTCPECGELHIDVLFKEKPHHTHACQACGMVWRPAIVPTIGVQFLPGFKDAAIAGESFFVAPKPAGEPMQVVLDQIRAERHRQDAQWGGPGHDDLHKHRDWTKFIEEHNDRASKVIADAKGRPDLDQYRKQLVEIAALAVAAIESLDRKRSATR